MTKFNIGDVVVNMYVPSDIGTISSFSSTTYSMLLFTGGYSTFPVSLEDMYRLATSEEIPGSTPPVTCTGGSPHYGTGCALLKHFDSDNDGKVTLKNAITALKSGASEEEARFIVGAVHAGSINAKCPGCYTPARVCTEGAVRSPETCRDGSVIHKEVCRGNAWVSTGATCPTPPPVTCTGGSPHHGTGCALLKHYDTDNDGRVTSADALRARNDGMTVPEVQFILDASAAGSINAKCPGCYTPARVCTEGAVRSPETCRDGSVIHKEVCRGNAWVSTGATCPTPPPVTCTGGSPHYGTGCALLKHFDEDNNGTISYAEMIKAGKAKSAGEITQEELVFVQLAFSKGAGGINLLCSGCYTPARVCTEGTMRSPETCWDGSVVHKEVCLGNAWVSTGATCLTKPEPKPPAPECTEGDKKPGHVCSGGKWVPVGTPPPAPECTEGDKKAGYVCSGGKWISTGEPSTIEAPEIIPGVKPPRIPLLTPELAKIPLLPGWVIRDADGRIVAGKEADTIEFQEIVPGIKPPRVPQLIPSLEKFPLLPGWTIRNREGTVVAHGAPLPTIGTEEP